jgi:glycosyltransferase involved in cell wall biosynthesis
MGCETTSQPLLTFALAALNQERFIREAIAGALAQTYSPLEIILSDDCSADRTFEIMCEMAKGYHGPHRVVLNRNRVRRCIGGHINRILEISRGELVLAAAGDDVSLPQRAQMAYEAWEASGRQATSIHSRILQIDEEGRRIEQVFKDHCPEAAAKVTVQNAEPLAYVRTLEPLIYGCAHAFARELFRVFGNLPEDVIHEDNAIGFRSILAGQLVFINEPLVKYRIHENNVFIGRRRAGATLKSLEQQEDRVRRGFHNRETMYRGFQSDLKTARDRLLIGATEYEQVSKEAARMQGQFSLMGRFLESGFFSRCRILWELRRGGLAGNQFQGLVRRLLPRRLLLLTRLARSRRLPGLT